MFCMCQKVYIIRTFFISDFIRYSKNKRNERTYQIIIFYLDLRPDIKICFILIITKDMVARLTVHPAADRQETMSLYAINLRTALLIFRDIMSYFL